MLSTLYNDSMKKSRVADNAQDSGTDYQGLRVWARTNRKLRILAALRGESTIALLDRLADDEMTRIGVSSLSSEEPIEDREK